MSYPATTVTHMTEPGEDRLYAAWRNPEGLIRPVGVLTRLRTAEGESYRFAYLKAAEQFDGFVCLPGLPELHSVYESEYLFPVFRNRLMPRSRPDYGHYVSELNLEVDTDPFEVLIRSEGRRATDRVEVFAHPERTPEDTLTTLFFVRGIRHIDGAAFRPSTTCRSGDRARTCGRAREPGEPAGCPVISTRTGKRLRLAMSPDYAWLRHDSRAARSG